MSLRLLDLFCCAGGAGEGYARAGFDVIGVDLVHHKSNPRHVILTDALTLRPSWIKEHFDAVHASPPCQRFSDLAKRNGNAADWPDLIDPTRALLEATGLPYIIENVEGAPLRNPVVLCGTMFPGLRVKRHRLFESNIKLVAPAKCPKKHPLHFTHDKRKAHYGRLDEMTAFVQVTGGGNCSKAAAADAMGIDWMTKEELNEAIPPAYTEWLGRQLLAHIEAGRIAA